MRSLKKLLAASAVILATVFTGCGSSGSATMKKMTADELAAEIKTKVTFSTELNKVDDSTAALMVEKANEDTEVYYYVGDGNSADEILIMVCSSIDAAKSEVEAAKTHLDTKHASFRDYLPDEDKKIGETEVLKDANLVVVCISADAKTTKNTVKDILAGAVVSSTGAAKSTAEAGSEEDTEALDPAAEDGSEVDTSEGEEGSTDDAEVSDTEDASETEETTEEEVDDGNYETITSKSNDLSYYGGKTVVIADDAAYELYSYSDKLAESYAGVINDVKKKVKDTANVYNIVVPNSFGVTFPDNLKDTVIGYVDQGEVTKKIIDKFDPGVVSIPLYNTMMKHRTEYIYYRTDHHWTDLGAYYAYSEYCKKAGLTAHDISDYEKKDFGEYTGSFYRTTKKSSKLTIDTCDAYFPVDFENIKMRITTQDGQDLGSKIITDGTKNGKSSKYIAFLCGDNPFSDITNENITDDSACIVVKESYGNAFVPFLADHYHKVYVVDYRYYKGSISSLAAEKGAKDIVFVNNVSMIRNNYLIGKLKQCE